MKCLKNLWSSNGPPIGILWPALFHLKEMFTETSYLSSCLNTSNCTMIEILIYLLLGACTGLLAGMFGIGGGSILVPSLIFIFYGMDFESSIIVLMAIGTSLASILFSAISSTFSHHNKKSVEWSLVIPLSMGMILGALVGAPTNAPKIIPIDKGTVSYTHLTLPTKA